MSEDENEMVTIKIPVASADHLLDEGCDFDEKLWAPVRSSVRAALDARKSLYERWLDDWGSMDRRVECLISNGWEEGEATTMAAAPDLLPALIDARRQLILLNVVGGCTCSNPDCDNRDLDIIDDAIKLALPPDVAAEVIGE